MANPKKNAPKHICEALKALFKDLGYDKKISQMQVIEKWSDIVGENIANIAQAERVQNNILYVKVKSMTWRTELLFQKKTILEKIKQNVGSDVVRDIRFH